MDKFNLTKENVALPAYACIDILYNNEIKRLFLIKIVYSQHTFSTVKRYSSNLEEDNLFYVDVDDFGNKYYYVNELLHNDHGPAIEYDHGNKFWFKNGELHREGGPAVEYADGDKYWYKNGKLHREDGPAVAFADRSKIWCKNDKRHREDGPAKECYDGSKEWSLYGKLYGYDDDFTNKSWKTFVKTLIFF